MEGRNDQESMDIIFSYLDSKDSSVRYWTVDILKGKQPVEVINKLIEMLENPEQRVVSITNVLIVAKKKVPIVIITLGLI